MIELEKNLDIFIESNIQDINNIVNNYINKKNEYEQFKNFFICIFMLLFSISTATLLFSAFVILISDNSSLYNYALNISLYSGLIGAGSLFFALFFEKLPFIKSKREKQKLKIEEALDKGISQEEQFNYLLFIDVLIKQCVDSAIPVKEKNRLFRIKKNMITVCSEQNQEKLFEFISKNSDFVTSIANKIFDFNKTTQEQKEFQTMYEQFVSKSGVLIDSPHNAEQKIKNIL